MSNLTTIIVAHRLSTIRDVDTIVVLKNGRVVESGNHLELMSDKKGEYAILVSLQLVLFWQEWKLLYLLLESCMYWMRFTLTLTVVSLVFIGVAVASVPIYMLHHYFYTLTGEQLTTRVRLSMFSGIWWRVETTLKLTPVLLPAREAITNIRTVAAFGLRHAFLWYASIIIKKQYSNFGDIIKSFMVLVITALSIAETLALAPNILKGSQALRPVFSILERRTAIDPNDSTSEGITEIEGDVEFRNVSFSYPMTPDVSVFKDLNLRVSAGSNRALVGPSGSGKSSVIALMMRFYDPTSGSILIDGRVIRCLNLRSLRLKIGLVQQEPALFSTTVYENIQYGKDGASEIEVIRAAKAANAHDFISRMPEGYHTQVGERGVQLSGGQKQRVAIAREILKYPAILLLDEATSALDSASEMTVQEALDKLMKGRTTIIITHRLSTIRDVDMICVLQHGKAVEHGSHEELMSKPGSVYT
ncbi:hypothetical protein IFM89_001949 [Coptis chinensis]|uniref:ABC transporter domain-containing protein n=1 Tax=Coptis chinensis TaxID=261450 RepID=A0A835IUI4_9MAGN|nr:hypothetical protein IFM89_001949 [Coptis chinensis]